MAELRYGLVKSGLDAHTLGLSSLAQILEDCGFHVCIADAAITEAVDKIKEHGFVEIFRNWILDKKISRLGFSYRLDPKQGLETFGRLVYQIDRDPRLSSSIKEIYFAGLPEACELVEKEFKGRFSTFRGDESPIETLRKVGVPESLIPRTVLENSAYDDLRLDFGKVLIREEKQFAVKPFERSAYNAYKEFGTKQDHLVKRLKYAREHRQLPLTRVHVGPYLKEREKALALFSDWLKKLAKTGFLDIISVGSSQLSQSNFGEDWDDRPNGGGVPFNSELELQAIRESAAPMLVRAYSGTKNVARMAAILEENLNMAWHALSLWWFNIIDGRGPLTVRQGIKEHIEAIQYIAGKGKPYEPNIPHHFAFRGSDDVTYVVSAYLAAKLAKLSGIRYFVLQNMLNTPRSTWGIMDLAKARAMLKLIRGLEDDRFRVIYQPRAGLDYFSPDMDKARAQLAAVTALMMDVEPDKRESPDIIHVVSYSEARFLANPDVINESIQITRAAAKYYPEFRERNAFEEITSGQDVKVRTECLWEDAGKLIGSMEKNISDLYTPGGLYQVFKRGYFPVPFLWEGRDEFASAVNWVTRIINGGMVVVDEKGHKMDVQTRIERIDALNRS